MQIWEKKISSNPQRQVRNVYYFTILIPLYHMLLNLANILIDLYNFFQLYLKIADQN